MAAEEKKDPYIFDSNQLLALTIAFDVVEKKAQGKLLFQSPARVEEALNASTKFFATENASAVIRTLPKGSLLSNIHQLPTPVECEKHPLVLELCYVEGSSVVYGKLSVCLVYYDGLTATQLFLNVLEYLYHHQEGISPSLYMTKNTFKQANDPYAFGVQQILFKLLPHLFMLSVYGLMGICHKLFFSEAPLRKGPLVALGEDQAPPRILQVWSKVGLPFQDVLDVFEQARQLWQMDKVGFTVNYAPTVVVGFVESFRQVVSRTCRMQGRTFPPGIPPMGYALVALLSTCAFFNNYGVFQYNLPSKNIVPIGFLWDWTTWWKTMCPLLFVVSLNDTLFVEAHMPQWCYVVTHDLFRDAFGEGELVEAIGK